MTRIIADAGLSGLGTVLVQLQGDSWRVIAYALHNLTDVERHYSQTEKEALALVWECERVNPYVFGCECELETDHKPLKFIYGKTSKPSARIERWVLRLQGYDYKVVYRPGKANIADALSRLNQTTPCDVNGDKLDGPLPTGESLLVVMDYYSRFYEVGILGWTTVDYSVYPLWVFVQCEIGQWTAVRLPGVQRFLGRAWN